MKKQEPDMQDMEIAVKLNNKKIHLLIAGVVMVSALGCRTESSEFNWKTFRWEQVGPRNHPRIIAEDGELIEQMPESPKPNLTAKRQTAFAKSQIVRLYLCSKTPTSIEEGSYYLTKNAPVDKLSDLLSILYPGEGPGGSEEIRYMLYRSDAVWERAKAFASVLDISSIDKGTYVTDQGSWETALGLLYGSEYPRKLDAGTRARIVSHLTHVTQDVSADRRIRWAAAILAGNLSARFDPKDYVLADAMFGEATELSPGDEFESMVTQYHHISLLVVMKQQLRAKKQAIDALNFYQRWASTECYERISMIAAGK
jgi:hypothetical protein